MSEPWPDLASEALGGVALAASDEFFAEKENLLKAASPVFLPEKFTDRGKWMDGWESRRRRAPAPWGMADWCVIRLGVQGEIRLLEIDTAHFLGNSPLCAGVDGCRASDEAAVAAAGIVRAGGAFWTELVPTAPLQPGCRNRFPALARGQWTHLRLRIYPDGGVARFRAFGEPHTGEICPGKLADLAALASGGLAVASSDSFFGAMENLIAPGRARTMGEGWETRRRRGQGNDWIVVKLAAPAALERIEIDTHHFKGNFPDRASVDGCFAPGARLESFRGYSPDPLEWKAVVPEAALQADQNHVFAGLAATGPFTHLRLSVFPDGGVSRFRAFARPIAGPVDKGPSRPIAALNGMPPVTAREQFLRCLGAEAWAGAMTARRPFADAGELFATAEEEADRLGADDWKEAFLAHPRIGERRSPGGERAQEPTTPARGAAPEWSNAEQSRASATGGESIAKDLRDGNREYDHRFGYRYIVCATGKSSATILADLKERLGNAPDRELARASDEQRKITRIRLAKLIEALAGSSGGGEVP